MIDVLRKLLGLAERRDRLRFAALCAVLIMNGAFEAIGLAAVFGLVTALQNPAAVLGHPAVAGARQALGIGSDFGVLAALAAAFFCVFALKNAVLLFATWLKLRIQWSFQWRLSTRLLAGYLARPLSFHIANNSAHLSQNVSGACAAVAITGVVATCDLVADLMVLSATAGVVLWALPQQAAIAIAVGVLVLGLYWRVANARFAAWGRMTREAGLAAGRTVLESLAGIKSVKLGGTERFFVGKYGREVDRMAAAGIRNGTIQQLPRMTLEILLVGGILSAVLYAIGAGLDTPTLIPVLAVFAAAAYRLMPALIRIVGHFQNLRFATASVEIVHRHLVDPLDPPSPGGGTATEGPAPPVAEIRLADIEFSYGGARKALDGARLRARTGAIVAVVGPSGAGKTTLVDVMLGLLRPQAGVLSVDGTPLDGAPPAALFGYVPQETFLIDDTIAANVALGKEKADVDPARVRRALEMSALSEVVARLPQGLKAEVGERGLRLSGGQRQRLGLARALYADPPVLVLDEATSALDAETEAEIARALEGLRARKAIVVIAHRLSTVRAADEIFYMREGRTEDSGTFEELLARCAGFRRLVELSELR